MNIQAHSPSLNDPKKQHILDLGDKSKISNKTICDTADKYWMLVDKTITAVPKSPNTKLSSFKLMPNRQLSSGEKKSPVYIGIEDGNLCLCCEGSADQPTLQVEEKDIQDLYNNGDKTMRFSFYQNTSGSNTFNFESAAHPGWFICTSPHPQEPVGLTNKLGETFITDFHF
ncbi:interleukin-36 alpha-like [Ornithorhynchus anatinus]|uniref:interleukin-36 alpha-like n=1 Tax=Ornithorhynchus anatinus TaxID=9258 RepID=UPI0001554E3A|nr:interleukin-36 alpha-like [Ornithorhynchus anatinus]